MVAKLSSDFFVMYGTNFSGLQCLFSWALCMLYRLVTCFSLLFLCRTLGQNADNERNYDLENDVNLAKSLQQYLKYLRILSQSAATNLYPRKTNDKASVKVVFLTWFLHSVIFGFLLLWILLIFQFSLLSQDQTLFLTASSNWLS